MPPSFGRQLAEQSKILIAFLAGAFLIVTLRLLSLPGIGSAVLASLAAIIVMILHGYARKDEASKQRVGDDTYYLGLLFTLVSLIYTLVLLFLVNPDGDIEQKTQSVVGNFGIALVSTVAGILGRIWLSSMNMGDEEAESAQAGDRDSAQSLEDVLALRRELRDATEAMRHFSRLTVSEAGQAQTFLKRVVESAVRQMQADAETSVKKSTDTWQSLASDVSRLNSAVEKSLRTFDAMGEQVAQSSQQARAQFAAHMKELDSEILKSKQLIASSRGTGQALESGTRSMQAFIGILEKAGKAINELEGTLAKVDTSVKSIAQSAARIEQQRGIFPSFFARSGRSESGGQP